MTEEGTEAAAATGLVFTTECLIIEPDPVEFRADQAFAFAVVHERTNIVFLGQTV